MKFKHVIFLILISLSGITNASHIVGGGFNIVWLHDSTYQLTLRILRDCSSQTQLDKTISVGIFDKQTDLRQDIIMMDLGPVNKINFISVKCMSVPSGVCTELGSYTKVITLSPKKYNNSVGYYISWERCCRNNIISNITNPGNSSMAFYMEIPPPKLIKNSSPTWNNNPKLLLCVGNPFTYNFNFTDPDGDSLVYSLVDPENSETAYMQAIMDMKDNQSVKAISSLNSAVKLGFADLNRLQKDSAFLPIKDQKDFVEICNTLENKK